MPDEDGRTLVHRLIYEELCRVVVLEESRTAYRQVIEDLLRTGTDGVILDCTEIVLLIG